MEYSKALRIKASVCDAGKISELVDFVYDHYKKTSDKFSKPDFKIERKTGEIVNYPLKEFKKALSQVYSFRGLNISFWSKQMRIDIKTYGWSNEINVDLSSSSEGDLMQTEKYIKEIFAGKSWNSYSNSFFYFFYFILSISLLFVITVKMKLDIDMFKLLFYLSLIPLLFLIDKFKYTYPGLVLINNNNKSGRILKKDLWFFLVTLVIPVLINKLT